MAKDRQKESGGYYDYDLDIESILVSNGQLYDLLDLKDIQQRKLYLNDLITKDSVSDIVRHILQYNADDKRLAPEERKPILLYLTSHGGEVDPGFELIDVIMASKTPVYTINLGYQYSMAFLIGLAGHKRYATRNAKYLMHDGSQMIYDSGAKVQDQVEFSKRISERIREYVLSRSRVTEEELDSKHRVEWYLYADDAKEKGFVDYIIGVDCGIGEVV